MPMTFEEAEEEQEREPGDDELISFGITDGAGIAAAVFIWVVAHARDEHRQAIEWLNQHTDSDFGFFLVEVELWKIGDSRPAFRRGRAAERVDQDREALRGA